MSRTAAAAGNDAEFTIRVTGAAPPPLPAGNKKGKGRGGRGKKASKNNAATQQSRYNMRLRPSSSLDRFRKDVFALFNVASISVDSYRLSFLGGFPPKELNSEGKLTVHDLGIRPNESLIVKFALVDDDAKEGKAAKVKNGNRKDPPEKKAAAAKQQSTTSRPESSVASGSTGRQKRAAAMAANSKFAEVIAAQDAIMKKESKKKSPKKKASSSNNVGGFGNNKRIVTMNAAPAGKKGKAAKMEGAGYRLSDGKSFAGSPSKMGGKRKQQQLEFSSKDDIANTLLGSGNGKGGNAGKFLRAAMRGAVAKSYEASRAEVRVAAVNMGGFAFEKVKGGSIVEGGGVVLGTAGDHGPQNDGDANVEDEYNAERTLFTVSYSKGMEGRGRYEEQVEIIGAAAVKMVLESVYNTASSQNDHEEDEEEEAIPNADKDGRLRPALIAQLSPRAFWSLVYHCSQPEHTYGSISSSVEDMLRSTMPNLDWSHLDRGGRKRALSEKARENLRQKKKSAGTATDQSTSRQSSDHGEEAGVRALEEMEESMMGAVMSSEEGGDQGLNERDRRARAAMSRFDNETNDAPSASPPARPKYDTVNDWKLVTPEDDDIDELIECIMEGASKSSEEASYDEDGAKAWANMLLHTVRNWRELANSNPEYILSKLDDNSNLPALSTDTVEKWIDAAQERTLEEIMIEILDGDQDALEALRDKARSSSPRKLMFWQHTPQMLVNTLMACDNKSAETELKKWNESDVMRWIGRAKTALGVCTWLEEFS